MNEGEDLELSVLIEAYPHITEHRWHTPTSPNTSTQEHKLIRYNNRYKTEAKADERKESSILLLQNVSTVKIKSTTIKCTTGRGSYSGNEKRCQCILGEFDREHGGHYKSSGHETAA